MKCNGLTPPLLAAALAVLATSTTPASAHGVDPIGLALVEGPPGDVRVRLDRPVSLAAIELEITLDADCSQRGERVRMVGPARAVDSYELHCGRALAGQHVRVEGLAAAQLDVVFRAELHDGAVHRHVITADAPEVSLPVTPSGWATFLGYLGLGTKHLVIGLDHLLFIGGTLLLERSLRRAALALTAFTAGHSLTLCAAALGWLRLPAAWAEVGIALSLVWLAVLVARAAPHGSRRVLWTCGGMGLVHGLGFASALSEAGVPARELPLALFGFNLGIELAQLAVTVSAFGLAALAVRARLPRPERGRVWLAHAIGAVAVMWCIERVLAV